MPRPRTHRTPLAIGLVAAALLAGCGDNPGGQPPSGERPAVALDRNLVTGPSSDIAMCSRYPARC